MTEAHQEKETLQVEVNVPEHEDRVTTALFIRTRKALIERDKCCYVSGMTEEECKAQGGSLEAHHHPIERCLAHLVDWPGFITEAKAGKWGLGPQAFDWDAFDPKNPYTFVDDMLHNGMLLAKRFHTGKDEGIHCMPYPLWIAQKYAVEGYKFSDVEVVHHFDQSNL